MGLVGGRGAKTSKMGSLPLGNTHLKGRSAWHTWKDLKRTQTLWVERSSLGGGEGGLGVPEEQAFLQGGAPGWKSALTGSVHHFYRLLLYLNLL